MSENIVNFTGITRLDVPADRILEAALGELECAVVVGFDNDGGFWFSSSLADGADVLWLLRKAEHELMAVCGDDQ